MTLLQDSTSSVHSLLMIIERPSTCDVASGRNASDLEHMHFCSFGMAKTLQSSMYSSFVKRSGMNIGISSMSGSWSRDLGGLVISSMCGGGGEDAADRMWSCYFSLGWSSGSGGLSKTPMYWVVLRNLSRIVLTSAIVMYMSSEELQSLRYAREKTTMARYFASILRVGLLFCAEILGGRDRGSFEEDKGR